MNDFLNVETPFLKVNNEIMINNLKEMSNHCKNKNIKLRPHIKTHKSSYIAKKQIKLSSSGITVAKLSEAEVMIENGINDILVAYPIVSYQKIKKLFDLYNRSNIKVGIDSITGAQELSEFFNKTNKILKVNLIVNTGLNRCGVEPNDSGIKMANEITKLPGLKLTGIFSHEGHLGKHKDPLIIKNKSRELANKFVRFAYKLKKNNIKINEVSLGATPSAYFTSEVKGVTEIRPGTYVFNDINTLRTGVIDIDDCALSLIATVVSKPKKNRIIIDAGSKTLFSSEVIDDTKYRGFGFIKNLENSYITKLSEEHGIIEFYGDSKIEIGDQVEIIPNHVCPVVNLFDNIYLTEKNIIKKKIKIDARGKSQ